MKNNNYSQLVKENDFSNQIPQRKLAKSNIKSIIPFIKSIYLIITLIFLIINLYLASLVQAAKELLSTKNVLYQESKNQLEEKHKELQDKREYINDYTGSIMMRQTTVIEKDSILKDKKKKREGLMKQIKDFKLFKIELKGEAGMQDDFPASVILSKGQKEKLEEWTRGSIGLLCFRSSRDGFNPAVFHHNCDQFKASVTVIATANKQIIGGFTSRQWEGDIFKYDANAFLFSFNTKKVYRGRGDVVAIYAHPRSLPSFGMGDLVISESTEAISDKLKSFIGDSVDYELNNGEKYLNIRELEVFEIIR